MSSFRRVRLTGPEWASLWDSMPAMHRYEDKATKKQKEALWSMGIEDEIVLESLGKQQASWLIDQALNFKKPEDSFWVGVLICLVIIAVLFWLISRSH